MRRWRRGGRPRLGGLKTVLTEQGKGLIKVEKGPNLSYLRGGDKGMINGKGGSEMVALSGAAGQTVTVMEGENDLYD